MSTTYLFKSKIEFIIIQDHYTSTGITLLWVRGNPHCDASQATICRLCDNESEPVVVSIGSDDSLIPKCDMTWYFPCGIAIFDTEASILYVLVQLINPLGNNKSGWNRSSGFSRNNTQIWVLSFTLEMSAIVDRLWIIKITAEECIMFILSEVMWHLSWPHIRCLLTLSVFCSCCLFFCKL
jgi:hypothetical protein